jgi:8-amino-7-oxononanoate synthase
MDHAMVFSTGYQANLGIISTMAGKGDYIVLDIDSHASIWDGCKMGDAEVVPFKHNDIEAMEKRLKRIPEGAGKLVVLEGVYSMLGDIAPLKEMIAVAKVAWRDGAGGRGALDGLHRPQRARRGRRPGRAGRGRFRDRYLLQDRSARSAASAFPTTRSSRSCGWCAAPMSSPPRLPPSVVATATTSIRKLMHAEQQARASVGKFATLHKGCKARASSSAPTARKARSSR